MRKGKWAGALLLGLLATSSSWAQLHYFTGGFVPTDITNKSIDMSHIVAPIQSPVAAPTQFSLTRFFPNFSFPSFPLMFSTSPYPAPSSFPSTHYPNTFQPLPPIYPH